MEIINTEINHIIKVVKETLHKTLSEEQAFEFLSAFLFCYKNDNIKAELFNIDSSITNGPNDGGIDFVYYDDENTKVVLGQCKFTENIGLNDVISELNKMSSTLENFKIHNTGAYNQRLKTELQNALDRLPDGDEGNVEYWIFTIAELNEDDINIKIESEHNVYSKEMVNVFTIDDLISKIRELIERIHTVANYSVKIDKPKNYLEYETENASGVMVNISSNSLIGMYNSYKDAGLFDMNIRKYIKNKIVDDGIKKTLDSERENFWFFNNGIIIACEDFDIDGDTVKIEEFSIVNGGQTTNLIGNYRGSNSQEFFIPCKIIMVNKNSTKLYSKIAEATNSQKPIFPRDLKANSPEMRNLQNWLDKEDIYLEIKRGEKRRANKKYKIKNDELGQLMLSFIYQQPGTARSGKKTIFDNNSHYNKLYKQNYEKDYNKKRFLLDLIKLSDDYSIIEEKLKNGNELKPDLKIILKNSKFIIMALFGITYMIENNDIEMTEILNDPDILYTKNFEYGSFISNYGRDDYENKLKELIKLIVMSLGNIYEVAVRQNSVSSVSNLFKTDKRYRESIVVEFLQSITLDYYKSLFDSYRQIFHR